MNQFKELAEGIALEFPSEGLDADDINYIAHLLEYHECEPSVAAEQISKLLRVSYETIYNLL